ncbi:hypothetical protein [Streptomyces sp. BH105]|uniref:hypothetical protein n=1 Tax=Streptomyces sp. BH105 TaxID=3410408 RepID=UPI003CE91517
MEEQVEWHREEFRGHEDELSSLTELAARAGVAATTVSTWIRRHASFPKIVMTRRGAVTTKYYSTAEFDEYREVQKELARQAQAKKTAPPRSPATIASERLEELKAQDERLATEESELAAKLAAVLQRRQAVSEEMGAVRRKLEKELTTIQNALDENQS